MELLGEHLIGNLDEDGYLRRELDAIVNDLAFTANISTTKEELEAVLKEVQGLDPAGVGARDLRECLLLQLQRMPHAVDTLTAKAIVDKHFDAFTKKHYDKILERLEIDEEALKSAMDEIMRLNPKPGNTERRHGQADPGDHPGFRREHGGRPAGAAAQRPQRTGAAREQAVPGHDRRSTSATRRTRPRRTRWCSSSRSWTAPSGSSMPSSSGSTPCSSPWKRSWSTSASSSSPAMRRS